MPAKWRDRIASTPEVLRGKARIKGTRISVALVLGHIAAGRTPDEIVAQFPGLSEEDVAACDECARELDALEELESIQAYDEAKASGDEAVPLE